MNPARQLQINDVRIYDRALSVEEIYPAADLTGDGVVGIADIVVFAGNWLVGVTP